MRRPGILAIGALALGGLVAGAAGRGETLDGLRAGMKAPVVTLDGLAGPPLRIPEQPGARAHLLVFWATWSDKSPEVLARAEELHGRYRERGLVVLGVNVENQAPSAEDVAAVQGMVRRLRLGFPILLDRGLAAFHAYGVVAVPSTVLVGSDGTVLADLAAYPIAGREEFFDLVDATVLGRAPTRPAPARGPQPDTRALRYLNLGQQMAARGLLDQAAGHLRRARELEPGFALPRILLAQISRERAFGHEAIPTPGGAPAVTNQLSDSRRAALLREAEQLLDEAMRLEPANPAPLAELALLQLGRGDRTRARELVDRALALDPVYPPARVQSGALWLAAGDLARGRAEMEAAIQLNQLDWRLHVLAAQAYETAGLTEPAARAYRRAVELLHESRRAAAAPTAP